MKYNCLFVLVLLLLTNQILASDTLFTLLPPNQTGILFRNDVVETNEINIITEGQNYVYSGGGVATGDVNNDGLPDIFLVGNMTSSKLYLNKGNLTFEDVSATSGIATNNWCTGVTMIDINNDGWLDIFVGSYGYPTIEKARCWLFINQKNGKFIEKAEDYGLINRNTNVSQASFFDYDQDGDMDVYLAIYPSKYKDEINFDFEDRYPTKIGSDKLFENINNKNFKDVSAKANIMPENAYALSILTTDINNDGWVDIYVGNDFAANNFLYINQGNKTFKESVRDYFDHTSFYTMGMETGDLNGDALPDIMELDMNPESNQKYKVDFHEFTFDIYRNVVKKYMRQEIRNNISLNNGNNTYSEIGQSLGTDLTDWSWTPLIRDFNLDGQNDIFVSNGIKKYVLNADFFFWKFDSLLQATGATHSPNYKVEMLKVVPTMLLTNYFFVNKGDGSFQNKANESGLNQITASNGAAYADLDGDGDDDLILNNMDDFAYIYRNNSDKNKPNFFSFRLLNTKGVSIDNVKYQLFAGNNTYYYEALNQRGFYSASDKCFTTGIGNNQAVDSLWVILPQNKYFVLKSPAINKLNTYTLTAQTKLSNLKIPKQKTLFDTQKMNELMNVENDYVDYKYQPSLLQQYTKMGPAAAVTTNKKTNITYLYYGTSKGSDKYLVALNQQQQIVNKTPFLLEKDKENTFALFFDANKDGHDDLLVLSGSGEWDEKDENLGANLYLNNGTMHFIIDTSFAKTNKHLIKALVFDYDKDEDTDIVLFPFIAPQDFPKGSEAVFLKNEKGIFSVDKKAATNSTGNYMDALTIDWNNDGWEDIVTLGHWMSPEVWINNKGTFNKISLSDTLKGYWSALDVFDIDGDGTEEIFMGNVGNNWRYNLSSEDSLVVWDADFNKDGVKDPIICTAEKGKYYPIYLYNDFTRNYPFTKKYILHQDDYSRADITQIFADFDFKKAHYYTCNFQKSVMLKKEKDGNYAPHILPEKIQEAPVNKFYAIDTPNAKSMLVLGQNKEMRDEIGTMDANRGQFFTYTTNNKWLYIPAYKTGINIQPETKEVLTLDNNTLLVITKEGTPIIIKYPSTTK